jgi:hypothetical protein
MRFRTVAVLAIALIPVPAALTISRFLPRAHAGAVPREAQPQVAEMAMPRESVREARPGEDVQPDGTYAGFVVTFPEDTHTGQFEAGGRLEINRDPGLRKPEKIGIAVIVEDAESGEVLDTRDHGTYVADPAEQYRIGVAEQFNLPPGAYRIRFYAFNPGTSQRRPDGKSRPALVAERTKVVTVQP